MFKMFSGSGKSIDFECFLLELLENFPIIKNNLTEYMFYMDNAVIHKSKSNNKKHLYY